MMKKQTISICFVLDPDQNSAGRKQEMHLVRTEFQEEGIPFSILEESAPDRLAAELPCSGKVISNTEILYAADSDRLFQKVKQLGLPAAAYRHSGNESQKFEGAEWILEEPQYVDWDSYEKIWQRLTGNPWLITETEHLLIREMGEKDLDALYDLYDDPAARRFLPPLSHDRNRERTILQAYIEKVYGLYGYGMWAVCDRKTGELIGRVGFEPYQGGNRAVELGYLIRADRRGQGLAVEAARGAIRFADENLDFPAIAIRTDAENTASIQVAVSLGFTETAAPSEKYPGAYGWQTDPRFTADREKALSVDERKNHGIRYFIRENRVESRR